MIRSQSWRTTNLSALLEILEKPVVLPFTLDTVMNSILWKNIPGLFQVPCSLGQNACRRCYLQAAYRQNAVLLEFLESLLVSVQGLSLPSLDRGDVNIVTISSRKKQSARFHNTVNSNGSQNVIMLSTRITLQSWYWYWYFIFDHLFILYWYLILISVSTILVIITSFRAF